MTTPTKPTEADDRERGLYRKFRVERLSDPTGKHRDCTYFVLDEAHDKYASAALRAYADACEAEFGQLARDLRARHPGAKQSTDLAAMTARASELERELAEANEIIGTQADKLNDSGQESLRNSTESMHTALLLLELAKELETLYSASQQEASMLDNLRLCALNRVKRIDALRSKHGLVTTPTPDGDGKGE